MYVRTYVFMYVCMNMCVCVCIAMGRIVCQWEVEPGGRRLYR